MLIPIRTCWGDFDKDITIVNERFSTVLYYIKFQTTLQYEFLKTVAVTNVMT